jgi:hypothetical protein
MLHYPIKKTEFEVQAELYNYLCSKGLDVRGELSFKCFPKRGARFDLVFFKNKIDKAIIEVKDSLRFNPNQEHSKAYYYGKITKLPQFTFFANDSKEKLQKSLLLLA